MPAAPIDPDVLVDLAPEPHQRGGQGVDLDVEARTTAPSGSG